MDATILATAALITAVAGLCGTVGTFLISWRTSQKVEVVHKATNSMKDELVAAVGKQQRSEGVIEGVASAAKAASDATAAIPAAEPKPAT